MFTFNLFRKRLSVAAAIKKVYPTLSNEFSGSELITKVKSKSGNHFDSTIMRVFFALKSKGQINCECVSRAKSIYKKTF